MNPSTTQARVIVDEMIRGGVREAVLCPGSRNAPFAFALHAADAAGRLRLHVRVDERTAGYLALGLAGRPGARPIVMTSGTAVANMSPAVFEANYARLPLVVISANRPYELLGSGANQTIEQFGIFGTQVRAAISLGLAENRTSTPTVSGVRPSGAGRRRRCPHRQCRAGAVRHPVARAAGSRSGRGARRCPSSPDGPTVRPGLTRRREARRARRHRHQRPTVVVSGHGAGITPSWPHCRPSPSRPRRPRRTRCIRWRCRRCVPPRRSSVAVRRCTVRCRRCSPIRMSGCTR